MSKVIVVGSCNVDLACFAPRMPKPGETLSGSSFFTCNGGKGANQAVMCAKLGTPTMMVARVGDDDFGRSYIESIKDCGVNTDAVIKTEGISTGIAIIIVSETTGENSIVITPGANGVLSVQDIERILPEILHSARVLVVQLEVNRQVTLTALKLAKKAGVVTIFNTAPAYADLDAEFFQNTDILCCNETEAEILTGKTFQYGDVQSEKDILRELIALGCKSVVLTVGKEGAKYMHENNQNVIIHALPTTEQKKIVDTTGAGDAFTGSLAHFVSCMDKTSDENPSILTHKILKHCVDIASLTVLKKGAQTSYPKLKEIPEELLR